jgi:outer membrane protein
MTRVLALATVVALAPAIATADTPAERTTLDECIAIALAEQPTLKAAGATVDAARERVWESTAAYLPQVSASYDADRRFTSTGNLTGGAFARGAGQTLVNRSRTFNFYSTGVALTQVLFDFGQNLSLIHRAQALAESVSADADTQHDAVVFNVSQAYLALLASYRLRDVADETVRQNEQHLALAQGRYEVGFAPRFDVTQAQVQVATAELNQVTARNNVTLGRETLRNTLGLSGPLTFDIVDVLDRPAVTIPDEKALDFAYDGRPELRSIRAQRDAAQHQIAAVEKDYLPKVGGSASYGYSGSEYPLQNNWDVGASVNLSLFNGGLTTAQVGEAKANLAVIEANWEGLRQNVELEVRQALLNVQQGVESIRVADKGLRQARENVELAEGRYSTGAGSIIELTDAQASLVSAEASRIQALVNYRTAVATLERAMAHRLE